MRGAERTLMLGAALLCLRRPQRPSRGYDAGSVAERVARWRFVLAASATNDVRVCCWAMRLARCSARCLVDATAAATVARQ